MYSFISWALGLFEILDIINDGMNIGLFVLMFYVLVMMPRTGITGSYERIISKLSRDIQTFSKEIEPINNLTSSIKSSFFDISLQAHIGSGLSGMRLYYGFNLYIPDN